jgi:hypothetical protein
VRLLLIGYDLYQRTPGAYAALTQGIRDLGQHWHGLDSTWFVSTPLTAIEAHDILKSHLRPRDVLVVMELPPLWWVASGLEQHEVAWLHERL